MKKSVLASTCLLLIALVGCNKTEDSVSPANNQHALGMVVQTAASGSSSNLILLRDGRTINPISGFAPTNLRAGNKFNLSFNVVPNSTSSKILDANVTNFTAANDSTFIPVSVGQDSATVKNFLNGTFTGTFTLASVNYSNVMDTTKVTQEVQATFTQSQYGVTIPAHNQSGGSGIYYFDRSNRLVINFVDSGNHPVNYDRNNLLNGQYTIVTIDTNLVAIYKTSNNNQNFAGYLLKRTGS